MRLGFTKNLVLPLPEPPITSTFLFRAVLGSLGRLFMVRRSVCVRRMLLSKTGSMYGAISLGPPHRALPYSSPLRYFLAFLPLQYTIRPQGGGTGDADQQVKAVEAGGRIFKGCRKSARKVQQLFPTGRPLLPAGTPGPACRTGTQTVDRAGWRLSVS